ncbi:PD-XK nuclease family transposase-domain-containing protein [Neocallimastix sp. 'constans']
MNIFEKEKKMLDPKNDVIFKNLFGVSQNKDIMIDFLNKILEFEKNPIVDLSYINTEIVPVKADKSLIGNMKKNNNEETNQSNEEKEVNDKEENNELYGKLGRMDVLVNSFIETPSSNYNLRETNERKKRDIDKIIYPENIDLLAKTRTNKLINIEIQMNNKGHMGKRSLYYAAGIIFHSLPRNEPYEKVPDLVMINILNYVAIKDSTVNIEQFKNESEYNAYINELQNRCHSVYTIQNTQTNKTEIFKNSLIFHFIELPKFLNEINKNQLESEKYSWIKFLLKPEIYKDTEKKLFKRAYNYLNYLGTRREIREAYERIEKVERDHLSAMNEYGKEKYIEGEKNGEKNGEKKGEKISAVRFVIPLLKKRKLSLDEIKDHCKLSKDDLKNIDNFINNPKRSIRELAIILNLDINQLIEICEISNIYYIEKEEFDKEKRRRFM